jgi:hypothetical protein
MSTSNYPSAYNQFKAITDLYTHSENKSLLGRFVYRYRLARSFDQIIAGGIGRTLKGYNAIFKVFLTYTAYEQLLKGAYGLRIFGVKSVKNNRIINEGIAAKLRSNNNLINVLIEYSNDGILVGQLVAFRNATNNDITCVAYAIRNIFAHGDLTSTAIGLALKSQRTTLLDLADFLLDYCDLTFTKCVEKLR